MSREDHVDKHAQLRAAIKKGDKKSAKELILNNALADSSNRKSFAHTLLHWAIIKFQDTEIVEILIDQKVNIRAKNHRRQTPLDLAVQQSRPKAVKLLLSRGAHNEEDLGSLIHSATTNGNDKIVKLLVDYGVENNLLINLNNSLNLAMKKGYAKIVKYIIHHCIFKKKDKKQISKDIVSKVGQQYNECIEILLQYGFSIPPGSEKDESFVYSAVKNGYTSIVRELLLLGINVNMKNEKTGLTILHAACLNKHFKITELLIKHKADVNSEVIEGNSPQNDSSSSEKMRSLVGKTALHIAVDNSDVKLTKLLLDSGATIKDDPNFFTVTSIAVQNECKEIIEVFLKHGADVNATDADGRTLLHLCSESKPRSYLYESKSRPSRFNYSTKHEIVELLLRQGANVNAQNQKGETSLFIALRNKYTKIVQVLLKYNASLDHVDVDGNTPLHMCAKSTDKIELIKLLLNHNAKINVANQDGRTPLHLACNRWWSEVVQMLLDHNAEINATDNHGMTPLHIAIRLGNLQTVKVLLERKADVNAKTNDGNTALHIICNRFPHYALDRIKFLLRYNADINAVDAVGRTPLFNACKSGYVPVVKLLLANKADVNHVDSYGMTPICAAAENSPNEFKVIEFLLDRKSTNVHFVTNAEETLLHILVTYSHVIIVDNYFDKMDININAMDKKGRTALHYAVVKGDLKMAKCLLKHGADINISSEHLNTALFYGFASVYWIRRDRRENLRNLEQSLDRANQNHDINRMLDTYRSEIHTSKKINQILKKHAIKLKCAGLNVSHVSRMLAYGNFRYIEEDSTDNDDEDDNNDDLGVQPYDFEKICAKEIEQLKLENVGKNNITFNDLLTKKNYYVAKYAKNESILQAFELDIYRKKFPLYIDIIKNRFVEGMKRSKLQEILQKYFYSRIFHRLPRNSLNEVFSYLSTEELKIFIEAVKPNNLGKKNV